MSTGNPDVNNGNVQLPPELQNFLNSKAAPVQNGNNSRLPNRFIKADGTTVTEQPKQTPSPAQQPAQAQQRSVSPPTPQQPETRQAPTTTRQDPPSEPVREDPFDFNDATPQPEKAVEAAPADDLDLDSEEVPSDAAKIAENFKKMRKVTRESKARAAEAAKKAEELELKVKEFNEGAFVPEVLQQKENEIAELKVYERLHALKTSKEYREKFVKPLDELTQKLERIGADYEVPKDILEEALGISNRRDLNHFLSSHFDEAGGSEVRSIFEQIKGIQASARQAELEPAKVLRDLQQEHAQMEVQRSVQRNNKIADQARTAWVKSVTHLRQSGNHPELTPRETDPNHNAHMNKLLQAASAEFGKAVKALVANGLQELPEEIGEYFANMSIRGHASVVNAMSRDRFAAEAERLEQQNKEINQFIRPVPGRNGTQGVGRTDSKEKPQSLQDAGKEALRRAGVPV